MILGTFILTIGALALALGGVLWIYASDRDRHVDAAAFSAIGVALFLVLAMVPAILLREVDYTLDARTYIELFQTWCTSGYAGREGFTFATSMALLNIAMFGACSPGLVVAAWAGIILVPIAVAPAPWQTRLLFLAAFLFSMPGIELLTNAMRQGFAAGFIVLALAFRKKNPTAAIVAAIAAIFFHVSSILFLLSYSISKIKYKYYFSILGLITAISVFLSNPPDLILNIIPELRFVAIYAQIESSDASARFLVMMNIFILAILPIMVDRSRMAAFEYDSDHAFFIKIALMSVFASSLPGFGYRFGYGIFPILSWIMIEDRGKAYARFPYMIATNAVIMLAWGFGSSYMRSVAFL